MATLDYAIPDELMDEFKKLGTNAEEIVLKMLNGAIPILETHVKEELEKHRISGDLLRSIKIIKAKQAKAGGYAASVEPSGTDRKGVRNVEKMLYLEYGTSRQPATPVLAKAIKDSEGEVLTTMQAIFDKEMGK